MRPSPLLAALVLAAACSGSTGPSDQLPLLEKLPRALTAGEEAAIAANNAFAVRLASKVATAEPDKNLFVSPLSVSMALGMVMNGAREATRDSMALTLGFGTTPQQTINESYRSLIALLLGLDKQVELSIANSLWLRQGFPIKPAFVNEAKQYFDAEAQTLDFRSPSALATINDWVKQETKGKIPSILDRIDDEILFAVNAVYFKGLWRDQFKKSETASGQFTTVTGTKQTVPFMHRRIAGPYWATDRFEAVDLWYGVGAHTMTVVLPKEGVPVDEVLRDLGPAQFGPVRNILVDLYLPRFKLEYKRSLVDDLKAMGMNIAFVDGANFRGIAEADLVITKVEHKTLVDVNEEGTEAAAATAVGVGPTSGPSEVTIRVDRPFIVLLRERLSGTVLFLGRLNSIPTA